MALYFEMYRSRRSQMFFKNFHNIYRKTPGLESLFSKVAGLQDCNFIQKKLQHRLFPVNIAEFLRIAFFIEHLWWLRECRAITLKQVEVASSVFLRCSFRKNISKFLEYGKKNIHCGE